MRISTDLTQLLGNTPLFTPVNYLKNKGVGAAVACKLEYFNPLGSVKDRVAYALIDDAEKRGVLRSGSTVVEPTSGNTGVGLGFVCAAKGYKLILTMPDSMSIERRRLLSALGAEIVLTPGSEGMTGAINKATEILAATPGAFMPSQFDNQAAVAMHKAITAQEIIKDTDGKVDFFVAGFGTGGTITGVAQGLKEQNPKVQIVGVEPAGSPVVSKGYKGKHGIQGIGAGFVPSILDVNIIDEVITVEDEDAKTTARDVARSDGLLVGISSGAALFAAADLAKRPENKGKLIVAILPDTGERYLSTGIYD